MDGYTARQKQDLLDQLAQGPAPPRCPRCGARCAVIRAAPRNDVAYVRNRVVIRCSGCLLSCAVEARKRGASG